MIELIPFIIIIVISYIPSFAWLGIVLSQDVHPEKSRDIALAFVLGSFVAVPGVLFAIWGKEVLGAMNIILNPIMSSFIFAALSEELFKGICIYYFAINTNKWDEPIDTFIYAGTLALGFAGIENLAFVLADSMGSFESMRQLLILRSFSAVLIHIVSSFFVTYGLLFLFKKHKRVLGLMIFSAGIGVHAIWNIAVSIAQNTGILWLLSFYLIICVPLFIGVIFTVKHLRIQSQ